MDILLYLQIGQQSSDVKNEVGKTRADTAQYRIN